MFKSSKNISTSTFCIQLNSNIPHIWATSKFGYIFSHYREKKKKVRVFITYSDYRIMVNTYHIKLQAIMFLHKA